MNARLSRSIPALSLVSRAAEQPHGEALLSALAHLRHPHGDGLIVEWGDRNDGLFALLGAAARAQRVLFPARWIAAPRHARSGLGGEDRILALARSDQALRRLFDAKEPQLVSGGLARPGEPLLLLGVKGDAVTGPSGSSPTELCRRAELWIRRLSPERVALVLPVGAGAEHPIVELARRRHLPLIALRDVEEPLEREIDAGVQTPLLWTDFQLDTEHRLPDDGFVPRLRDLLHRGSLVRERVLYERLPETWREQAEAELRALYLWHVAPLLRRVAALMQALLPVEGVRVLRPLPHVEGICGYLLGLTDLRPTRTGGDPEQRARALAEALATFDRTLRVEISEGAWTRVRARLVGWAEGGHLALCQPGSDGEAASAGRQTFCFSGQPLSQRVPLSERLDGFPVLRISTADRRALGWFDLELTAVARRGTDRESGADSTIPSPIEIPLIPADDEQLRLGFGGSA